MEFFPTRRKNIYRCVAFLMVLGLFVATGCSTIGKEENTYSQVTTKSIEAGPKLSIFLHLKDPGISSNIRMVVSSVEFLHGVEWLPVTTETFVVDTKQIGEGQIFVGRTKVPADKYSRIRFTIESAAIVRPRLPIPLRVEESVVEIPFPHSLDISGHESETIIVSFDAQNSVLDGNILRPALTIAPQVDPLVVDLAYVACPWINTIYLVRTDKNWVIDSIGVSGMPTYLGVDSRNNKLYVLAEEEAVIKVIEMSSSRLLDQIQVPMVTRPNFMVLSPDNRWAYVLDKRGNYILRLDLVSGTLAERVRLNERPAYVLYMPERQQLAVSLSYSNEVVFLDPERLTIKEIIQVGRDPEGTVAQDNFLYIAESGSNTVNVFDLSTRRTRRRLNVGLTPWRLWKTGNRIYISQHDGALSVLGSGQLHVSKELRINGRLLEMTSAENRQWLYVGDALSGGLVVVDTVSNKLVGNIQLGAVPLGLAVVQ